MTNVVCGMCGKTFANEYTRKRHEDRNTCIAKIQHKKRMERKKEMMKTIIASEKEDVRPIKMFDLTDLKDFITRQFLEQRAEVIGRLDTIEQRLMLVETRVDEALAIVIVHKQKEAKLLVRKPDVRRFKEGTPSVTTIPGFPSWENPAAVNHLIRQMRSCYQCGIFKGAATKWDHT